MFVTLASARSTTYKWLIVPCLQPDAEKQSSYSALALLIAGNVATERYAVLSTRFFRFLPALSVFSDIGFQAP